MVGNFVDFTFDERGNLVITLLPEGREEIEDRRSVGNSDLDIFYSITESYWTNGWSFVSAEEIGALMDDYTIFLTQERIEDDDGNLLSVGPVYYYPGDQIRSEVDAMINDGFVVMRKAD